MKGMQHSIHKPYSARLSEKYAGIEITYDEDPIMVVPIKKHGEQMLHTTIVNALNGAFLCGALSQHM